MREDTSLGCFERIVGNSHAGFPHEYLELYATGRPILSVSISFPADSSIGIFLLYRIDPAQIP